MWNGCGSWAVWQCFERYNLWWGKTEHLTLLCTQATGKDASTLLVHYGCCLRALHSLLSAGAAIFYSWLLRQKRKGSVIRGQMYCQHRACFYMGWISKMKREAKLFNVSCQESAWISAAQSVERLMLSPLPSARAHTHANTETWSGDAVRCCELLQVGHPGRQADVSHRG